MCPDESERESELDWGTVRVARIDHSGLGAGTSGCPAPGLVAGLLWAGAQRTTDSGQRTADSGQKTEDRRQECERPADLHASTPRSVRVSATFRQESDVPDIDGDAT